MLRQRCRRTNSDVKTGWRPTNASASTDIDHGIHDEDNVAILIGPRRSHVERSCPERVRPTNPVEAVAGHEWADVRKLDSGAVPG